MESPSLVSLPLPYRAAEKYLLSFGYAPDFVTRALLQAGLVMGTIAIGQHKVQRTGPGQTYTISSPKPASLPSDMIAEPELAAALRSTAAAANPEVQAAALFARARELRAESGKWITGGLYGVAETPPPWEELDAVSWGLLWRREKHGWFCYNTGARQADGEVDTSRFRHLIPES